MGIDLVNKRHKIQKNREATTDNNYHKLLIKLYKFLARRTDSKFNQIVFERLNHSRVNRYPISLSRLIKVTDNQEIRSNILVVVGAVLDDERMYECPKLRVCALRFSE